MKTATCLITLAALVPSAFAVRGEDNVAVRGIHAPRRLSPKDGPKKRECDINEKKDEIKFSCKTKQGDKETKIHDTIEYRVSSDASIAIKYHNKIKEGKDSVDTKTKYEISFDKLVEYASSSEDGSYSFENDDEQVQVIDVGDLGTFSDIVTDDDGDVSYFYLSNGLVEFNFTVHRADGEDPSIASANKMKIDFRLVEFPWSRNDTNVALFCTVGSTQRVKVGKKKSSKKADDITIPFEEAVEGTGITPFGEYTWATIAEATSDRLMDSEDVVVSASENNETAAPQATSTSTSTIEVIATTESNDDSTQTIAFAFVGEEASGASEIYWDPEAGVGYTSGGAPVAVSLFGIVGSALLMLLVQ